MDALDERTTPAVPDDCEEARRIAEILPKLPADARQRILGAAVYAEMVEAALSDKAS